MGEPIRTDSVNWMLKKAAHKAEIKKRMSPHLLRHSRGTIARTKGLALDTIAHQFGHESIATTQLYATWADDVYEREYQWLFDQGPQKPTVRRP